mgnify:CR=1 FL=1
MYCPACHYERQSNLEWQRKAMECIRHRNLGGDEKYYYIYFTFWDSNVFAVALRVRLRYATLRMTSIGYTFCIVLDICCTFLDSERCVAHFRFYWRQISTSLHFAQNDIYKVYVLYCLDIYCTFWDSNNLCCCPAGVSENIKKHM